MSIIKHPKIHNVEQIFQVILYRPKEVVVHYQNLEYERLPTRISYLGSLTLQCKVVI